jgi:type VI protein secretion system component VasK
MSGMWSPMLLQVLNPVGPVEPVGRAGGMILRDILLVVGLGLGLSLLLVWWARIYVRRMRRHRHRSQPAILQRAAECEEAGADDRSRRRHHHRRRRRRHREDHGRNPTLAETGGLPPIRPGPPAAPSA